MLCSGSSVVDGRRLIESVLPVDVLSRDAAVEMSFKPRAAYYARCRELGLKPPGRFYDPKIRSLHPWLARRPRSIARALNLSALLPENCADRFLELLGFTREKLLEAVGKGYPPLVSYTNPDTGLLREILGDSASVLDPMAGGGSIPLESLILGVRTIACEYNPVAFLILRATVEFPARYGVELYRRVREEALSLLSYAREKLSSLYDPRSNGYIVLRQVLLDGRAVPLASTVPVSRGSYVLVDESGARLVQGRAVLNCRRELLPLWMHQHRQLMSSGDGSLLTVLHRLLVVQTEDGFRLADDRDQRLLEKAYEEYARLKPHPLDVPLPADNEVFRELLPLGKYVCLFNPRQALALGLIAGYVKKRVRELVEKEGEFGAAVGLYLALGVDRLADFNSAVTTWNSRQATVRDTVGSYYKFRKFRLESVYAEAIVPFRTLEWIFEPNAVSETAGGICPVLRDLCERLEGRGDKVKIKMCSALELSKHLDEKVSVVNVDPPYYDQHVYSDFSEFFWVIMKTTLGESIHVYFGENSVRNWTPESWRVPREDEVVGRSLSDKSFEVKLEKALVEMKKVLRDDGVLVLWFSHRRLEAWKAVVKALRRAGFTPTNVVPFVSEHPTRSTTKSGESGLTRVLILVARKSEHAVPVDVNELKKRVADLVKKAKVHPLEKVRNEEVEVVLSAVDVIASVFG